MSSTLRWYFDRLAVMSARELPYRLKQKVQNNWEEYIYSGKQIPGVAPVVANNILEKCFKRRNTFPPEFEIFGKVINYLDDDIDWHLDIFSGKSFSLGFSKKINIRKDPELSAKNVWEINRLQFLSQICLNYNHTRDSVYLDLFMRIMNSWIDSNPYLIGINWYSNLEINIRLINWFFCWELLDVNNIVEENDEFGNFVTERWIPLIYQHCQFSFRNPSRFSSANNHLIAEYAGLFIASSKWKFSESEAWLKYAKRGLEDEIVAQHSNGVNREEAAEYIQFITDFFMISYVVGLKTNNPFSPVYVRTLKKIFEYILAIVDMKGNVPNYGDGDNGKVLALNPNRHFNNFLSLLTSAAVIFKEHRFKSGITTYDLKNELLFGKTGEKVYSSLEFSLNTEPHFYRNEGHYIFRDMKEGKEIYMHFDSAPLGYLKMAAHGHADALSVILNINGNNILADPGTYSYHVAKEWRDYFVSTMAHNTICIDNTNQARHAGDTIWLDHYKCTIVSENAGGFIESVKAEHNGYKNLKHIREVLYDRQGRSFTITDEILNSDSSEHECSLLYHIHPSVIVERLSPNNFLLSHRSGIVLSVLMEDFPYCSIVRGQMEPVLGWYSDAFMQKIATNVLYAKRTINKSFNSVTKILIHEY